MNFGNVSFGRAFARIFICVGVLGVLLTTALGCGGASSSEQGITRAVVTDMEGAPTGPLPKTVVPTHYALDLELDPDADTFTGVVRIEVSVGEPTSRIWLHGRNHTVSRATVTAGGKTIEAKYTQATESGVVALTLAEAVPAGTAVIELTWITPFAPGLEGLYRAESAGLRYAFTQFEATAARKMFPCFDEPAFKTPFDISLTIPSGLKAAANTLVVSEMPAKNGKKTLRFAKTEKLPTYLLALAVGDLDIVEAPAIAPNGVRTTPLPFRGVAAKGQGARLAYALEHTPEILNALEQYTGIPYPYDKLDIVAVPDFDAGAMENAGLITFREQLLLLDPATVTEGQRRGFVYVMAHELAHQWFGNLVTMKWWDDIWLNEAFASWMDNKITDELHPEFHVGAAAIVDTQRAMASDSLVAARQIRQPIVSHDDIENAFDAITYAKGSGVIEMIERWVGKETFQKGIRAYLAEHRFGNTSYEDMMRALDTAAARDVGSAFRTFLLQPGLPLVRVTTACGGGKAEVTVAQSRYLPVGSKGTAGSSWQIPMCVRYEVGGALKETCALIGQGNDKIALEGGVCPAWVMPNAEGAGYFRFALSSEDLEKLRTKAWKKLSTRERLALADSLSAAFGSGDAAAADVLDTAALFAKDPERSVATAPFATISSMWRYQADDAARAKLEAFVRKLYGPAFAKLGFSAKPKEDGETAILRAQLLGILLRVGRDERLLKEAAKLGVAYVGKDAVDTAAVNANLVDFVVGAALEVSGPEFFNTVITRALGSDDTMVRTGLIGAVGGVRNPELAAHARALVFDERVRLNEVRMLLGPQFSNRETQADAWKWLEANWTRFVERVTKDGAGGAPNYAARFCSVPDAEAAERFFGSKVGELPGGPRNLALASEGIRLCAALSEKQAPGVNAYFAGKK
jgi:alanyl aminopeptidase